MIYPRLMKDRARIIKMCSRRRNQRGNNEGGDDDDSEREASRVNPRLGYRLSVIHDKPNLVLGLKTVGLYTLSNTIPSHKFYIQNSSL